MKQTPKLNRLVPITLVALTLGMACTKEKLQEQQLVNPIQDKVITNSANNGLIDDQFIVLLPANFGADILSGIGDYDLRNTLLEPLIKSLLLGAGIDKPEIGSIYNTVYIGFSIKLTATQLNDLLLLPEVISVEQDALVKINGQLDTKQGPINTKAQTINYGVTRVGSASGVGKRAWIIDTGVDLDHPDLTVNTSLSKSFIGSTGGLFGLGLFGGGGGATSADDLNGHGTHCAGIIAAKDNTIGSKGVAYGAEVVGVQVLGADGSGATSVVIQGVDYVAANAKAGEVANMSLGGGTNTSLDNAVKNASNKGIYFALAAGNDGVDAATSSPARVNGTFIVTISSMDSQNKMSSFSNYGNPPVDFAEPGSSIYSSYKNGGYATMSGTSMAAPHAAGIVLLRGGVPANGGFITGDKDANPDVIGVK